MRGRTAGALLLLSGLFLCLVLSRTATGEGASSGAADAPTSSWNKQAAAQYLDQRETWWQGWPRAQKDHGTLCISCHTVVPYAMVRPELRRDLGDAAMTAQEKVMFDSVEKRVGDWAGMAPFYSDEKYGKGKAAESHVTEAVLNAVILASYDAAQGRLRPIRGRRSTRFGRFRRLMGHWRVDGSGRIFTWARGSRRSRAIRARRC